MELIQEAIGHHIYPVALDALGRVQVFVPGKKLKAAKKLLEKFETEQ